MTLVVVCTTFPEDFIVLNHLLLSHVGAKRRLELRVSRCHCLIYLCWINDLSPVIEAANGLRHVQLSGGSLKGSFRLWTGDLGYGEAEFSFEIRWRARGTGNGPLCPVIDLAALCDLLGVERVRTLALHTNSQDRIGSGKPFRQILLRKLPGVEVRTLDTTEYCS